MDWWKLFALLVAVVSFFSNAEGAKKKIRIHLPQKVKHIHHHKKIYITNHPASSQYAPAYLPTADAAGAVPSSVALPTKIVPFKSVDLYNDRQHPHLHGVTPSASKLLPLYRARGYYGPTPSEWDDQQEFDLVPPPEPTGPGFVPTAFSAPTAPEPSPSNIPPKRIKIIKVKESPRKKKILRKRKPKRIVNEVPPLEEDTPVSSFHEQFYSDLESAGTIKKIRKPKRVEKIVDGDTEHIHTYSEEHIHKVVYNNGPKLSGIAGSDHVGSMSGLSFKNHHSLLEGDRYTGLSSTGSLGTPSHMEYAAYSPRDVTHDHVIHDHGEIPPHLDLTKDTLGIPPKASYTSSGVKLSGGRYSTKNKKNKYKPPHSVDLSYYENMYSVGNTGRPRRPQRQPVRVNSDYSSEPHLDDFRPIPAFRYQDFKEKQKPRYPHYGHDQRKPSSGYYVGQSSVPVPFSTSNLQSYNGAPAGFTNFKDPFSSYDGVYSNSFGSDNSFASSSNLFGTKGKKTKSISTQNVSFGGQDHKTIVDHLAEASNIQEFMKEDPTQITSFDNYDDPKAIESATPATHFTITENTPEHEYYTAMAIKAFQSDPISMPEASNDNFQYVEAPEDVTLNQPTSATTTILPQNYYSMHDIETTTSEPHFSESISHKSRNKKRKQRHRNSSRTQHKAADDDHHQSQDSVSATRPHRIPVKSEKNVAKRPSTRFQHQSKEQPTTRGNYKYGDKL